MAQFEKHFTVEEANALLPELRELLTGIQAVRDELSVHWEAAVPILRAARMNGGGPAVDRYVSRLEELNRRVKQLAGLGVQLKDLERGLVDFPSWRDGREVFLCWHLGEAEVAHWHDIDAGFAGRAAL